MAANKLQNALTLTLLILQENLIFVSECNNCMVEKTTFQGKLYLIKVTRVNFMKSALGNMSKSSEFRSEKSLTV